MAQLSRMGRTGSKRHTRSSPARVATGWVALREPLRARYVIGGSTSGNAPAPAVAPGKAARARGFVACRSSHEAPGRLGFWPRTKGAAPAGSILDEEAAGGVRRSREEGLICKSIHLRCSLWLSPWGLPGAASRPRKRPRQRRRRKRLPAAQTLRPPARPPISRLKRLQRLPRRANRARCRRVVAALTSFRPVRSVAVSAHRCHGDGAGVPAFEHAGVRAGSFAIVRTCGGKERLPRSVRSPR